MKKEAIQCDTCNKELDLNQERLYVTHNMIKEVELDETVHGTSRGIMSESVTELDFCSYNCAEDYFAQFRDNKLELTHDE